MFTHLHLHTEFSLLDGLAKIDALTARATALGQEALAITDHGNLYGAVDFYKATKAAGLHPILGMEGYIAPAGRRERNAEARYRYHHLTLLAANATGWRNLIQLSTRAHLEGFYYRPRFDRELLAEYSEGLIVLSGCPSSELYQALLEDRQDDVRSIAEWYRSVFDDRYYLEIQNHGDEKFLPAIGRTVALGQELGIPLVATHDSHYVAPEDHISHEVLLCIGTNSTMQDPKRFKLDSKDFYLTSEAEMRDRFPDTPEALETTQRIAERCQVDLQFGRLLLPDPDLPPGVSAMEHLSDLAAKGLKQRYGTPTDDQVARLRYELGVVQETGFAEYFLIVMDFAHFAREQHIAMGVRGSAAASIILYCLAITDIDPLAYNLVFERFLNVERHEMPDIDMDFADNRRDEVIRYVAGKYGYDRVAQVITFGTLGAKAAIRDTGRALGMEFNDVDRVARLVPNQLNITLETALKSSADLQDAYTADPSVKALLDQARKLEGVARHAGTHAAAVVIGREPLVEHVPLQRPVRDEESPIPMTQWAMNQIAEVGLLKMDFLGLTNLTILDRAVDLIAELTGERVDILTLPDGDPKAFALLAAGDTFGVFQLESSGMRRYVQDLQPTRVEEVAAMVALYRPGPMEHIPRYIRAKHGQEPIQYPHPDLAGILDETYGVIVYQDQVLKIAQKFAGFTLGQADVMRKAMGKKIAAVMQAERGRFIEGAQALGYDKADAETVFALIEPFAGYAFNKAHAVCYGFIAYQTAYLKAHHPVPYMTAVLQSAADNTDRIALAAAECSRLEIPLLPPNVNQSGQTFAPERLADGRLAIRFGLTNVKNVGHGAIETLIAEREARGDFASVEDLCRRADLKAINKRVLESLIKAGALDALGPRGPLLAGIDRIVRLGQREQELKASGQTTMFDLFGDEVDTPRPSLELDQVEGAEATKAELLQWEKELLGAYLSEHPFHRIAASLEPHVTAQAAALSLEMEGQDAVIAGTVMTVRELTTRKGDRFVAVMLEDLSGSVEVTVWPDTYKTTPDLWQSGRVLLLHVRIRSRGERMTVAVENVTPYDETLDGGALRDDPAAWGVRDRSQRPRRERQARKPEAPAHPAPPPAAAAAAPPAAPSATPPAALAATPAQAPPAPAATAPRRTNGNGGNGNNGGAALILQVRLHETDDEDADQRRLHDLIQLIKGTPGSHRALLTVDAMGEQVTLELSRCNASYALLKALQSVLGEHGAVELESHAAAAVGG